MPEYIRASSASSSTDAESAKSKQYSDLLQIPNGKLPDPNDLKDWQSEETGLTSWPPTMAFDIGKYLQNVDNVTLRDRLLSDYKEGKAYSYFASGWVKEVLYHDVNEQSRFCFLKTECRPSQSISNIPWRVWVAIQKKSGEVHSAYCTCFAGFSGTCNHVAAILFKIDFAWRHGLTNPAVTSRECGWNAFGATKKTVEPKPVGEMVWSKPKFSRIGSPDEEGINPLTRQLFSPVESRSQAAGPHLQAILTAVGPEFEDACAFKYCEDYAPVVSGGGIAASNLLPFDDLNVGNYEEVVDSVVPPTLSSLASQAPTIASFLGTIPIFDARMIQEVERCTRGQSENAAWLEHRQGRITGSVVHSVLTRTRKLLSGKLEDNTPLVKRLLYSSVSPDIPALKYGREMEPEARSRYVEICRQFGHRSLSVTECGLIVHPKYAFLAASPDGLVQCACCGQGVLEIKCPLSISNDAPDIANIPYIEESTDGTLALKHTHPYYSQVQLEMAVTKTAWCDFFVYTRHGYLQASTL